MVTKRLQLKGAFAYKQKQLILRLLDCIVKTHS
jgi:hypothetical protein